MIPKLASSCLPFAVVPPSFLSQAAAKSGAMSDWQAQGMIDWMNLYYLTNRFQAVTSDLPLLGIVPTGLKEWAHAHDRDFL